MSWTIREMARCCVEWAVIDNEARRGRELESGEKGWLDKEEERALAVEKRTARWFQLASEGKEISPLAVEKIARSRSQRFRSAFASLTNSRQRPREGIQEPLQLRRLRWCPTR